MAFTFVHTADWQIGKAFAHFPPEAAAQLRSARLDAIDRVAQVAIGSGAAHVIVAGDVVDSELIEDLGLRQILARLAAYPHLMWHLLPGNHDPVRGGSVWERWARLGVPPNVTLLVAASTYRVAQGVVLLPAPLTARQMTGDPTSWMDDAASTDGDLRIGVAHGSVRGFGSLGEAAVPIEAGRRLSARLDYLALGDWHGTKEIATGVWYSGTPEPDGFADNEPGHVLVVTIDGQGAAPRVQRVNTAHYRWMERRAILARSADLQAIEREVAGLGAEGRRSVVRLVLEGAVSAAEGAIIDERLDELSAHPFTMRVERQRLSILAAKSDRELLEDPRLAAVADRLIARSASGDDAQARIAAHAMRLLLAFSAGTGRAGDNA